MRAALATGLATGALMLSAINPAMSAVKEREVEYKAGDLTLKGMLAYDDAAKTPQPGVLVVHEWWGFNDHARNSARKLAKEGFTSLALDMYGEGKQAHHPDAAGKMSSEVAKNEEVMKARFDAAKDFLTKQKNVDPSRLAAIGYCFGGFVVLEMARQGEPLKGVVTFHGDLETRQPAQNGKIKPDILVLTGAADPFVPKTQVDAFEKEMDAAGARYKIVTYPGAKHGFTNPEATENGKKFNIPIEYNAQADQQSWAEAMTFLKKVLAAK